MNRREFTVHDRLGPMIVTGELLVEARWGSDRKPRWTDMALYQVVDTTSAPDEEPFRYALEIIARSWVYHRVGGPCARKRHKITTVANVRRSPGRWRKLYPCWKEGCKPPELEGMRDWEKIAEEREDSHVYLCTKAENIISRLYRHNGEISGLAANLLTEAARKDPDIAQVLSGTRRV